MKNKESRTQMAIISNYIQRYILNLNINTTFVTKNVDIQNQANINTLHFRDT